MQYLIKFFWVIPLFFLFENSVNAETKVPDEQSTSALIQGLKTGGYIIYMRHGLTTRKDESRDKSLIDLTRCETQRNLTEEGKSQVEHLGLLIKSLEIPIGQVKSSPFCRTKETASAVFGEYKIDEKLRFSISMKSNESEVLGKYLLDSMLASNDIEKNTVYVGHTANLKDGLGVWPKPEGVMVIFKKEGNEIIFEGMIKPDDWPNL